MTAHAEILALLKQFQGCFPHLKEKIGSLEEYAKKLSAHAEVVVALSEEGTLGLVVYYANDLAGRVGYISLIGVLPEYRRSGYGKLLLDAAASQMQAAGMRTIKLEVDNDNAAAFGFYRSYGFNVHSAAGKNSTYLSYTI